MEIIRGLLTQSNANGTRTTALNPIQWLIATLGACLIFAIRSNPERWVIIILVILIVSLIILYISAYLYLLFNDRDALRSESYTLNKMAIEKGLMGDSSTGLKPYLEIPKRHQHTSKIEGGK